MQTRVPGFAVLGCFLVATPGRVTGQVPDKIDLRFRPPAGEAIRYKDQYELWITIGSALAREPAIRVEIYRTETADTHGDSIIVVSVVDSARVRTDAFAATNALQTARMMRGTRETIVYTDRGREISRTVRGVTEAQLFAAIYGEEYRQEEYRQWRTMPEDSVEEGGRWTDSVRIRADSVEWRGRVEYRLRKVERRSGRLVAQTQSRGELRARGLVPVRVSGDTWWDVETGRLMSADIEQRGGITGRYLSADIRSTWRIQRLDRE